MNFDADLAEQVGAVFAGNSDIRDHRSLHPWLTGSIGNLKSGICFVAENPSLVQVERATNPEGGPLTPEAQWSASRGDRLFREALVLAGFKDPKWDSIGGWHCYITNVIKEADYAEARKKKGEQAHLRSARIWSPVLRWEMEKLAPKLVVLMGKKTAKLMRHLEEQGMVNFPNTMTIDHYSYVAHRPRGKLGPMHPERVEAYRASMLRVREHFDRLK